MNKTSKYRNLQNINIENTKYISKYSIRQK